MRMLRWMSGHVREDKIFNDCVWEKVVVATFKETVRGFSDKI